MSSSSPRSSVLRNLNNKGSSMDTYDIARRFEENVRPVLMLVAVVVAVVVAWVIGSKYEDVATQLGWSEVFRSGTLAGVTVLLVLGSTAWATASSYMEADYTTRLVIVSLFTLVSLAFGVSLYLFFCRSDRTVAFYLMVAVVVCVLVQAYLCWRSSGVYGALGLVPAAVLGVFLLWRFWPDDILPVV